MKNINTNKKLFKMSEIITSTQLSNLKSSFDRLQIKQWVVMLLCAFGLSIQLEAQCFTVTKTLLGVAPATSGIQGNIDVTYQIEVTNANCLIAANIDVRDNAGLGSNFGTALVGVVGAPVLVSIDNPAPNKGGVLNLAFTGITPNDNLTDGSGFLLLGEKVIYRVTFQVNPRASGAPASLNNFVTVNNSLPIPGVAVNSNVATIPNCWTNCQLACNNTVQVSVNSMCEAQIVSQMILEGESTECADLGFYQVTIYYNNQLVNLPLGQSWIGKKLRVNVRNIVCGNSCWGNLLLEDKTPPVLVCDPRDTFSCGISIDPINLGFPVNPAFVNTNVYPYIVNGIDACGTVSLKYRDSIVRYDCLNRALSATIYRTWCATDPGGYTNCCTDTIDLQRGTIADITLPPHFDGQPGNRPALSCSGKWKKLPNGLPDTSEIKNDLITGELIGGTGRPLGIFCGNIQFDFSDDTIAVCPGTYKLLRRWLIIDWCDPNNRVNFIQLIKVVDESAPKVTCPTTITISTNPTTCTGSYILPVPQDLLPGTIPDGRVPYVLENCSNWTYSVSHLAAIDPNDCTPDPNTTGSTKNITRMPDGRYRVDNMPLGCNWIYYTICDACGNCTPCTFDIFVEDKTPPVAVCQQKTVVSLTSNGWATIPASVFNGGSHDNCEMGSYKVRRMNPGPCGISGTTFADSLAFCCADIRNNPIRVVLRVLDKAGNSSECMVDVIVQDKLPPVITCPADVVVSCETDLSNLNVFGTATATDNCGFTISTRIENGLSNCGVGVITRWFIATDDGGRKDSCAQTITVRDTMPFRFADIIWPADIVIEGCKNSVSTDVTGKPIYKNQDHCNQVVASYKDLSFNFVEGVCYKILRQWTVIDWCTYDAHNPTTGVWYHTQVIKINNSKAPDFTSSCADRELCITENCSVNASFSATATDDCTPQDELLWSYTLDKLNNGSVDANGSNPRFNATLEVGTHKVTWTVSDQCGNKSTCSYLVKVRDCKAPTPYCNPGIITVIMPSNREVTIWAKDFDLGSFDNCTQANNLKFSMSPNVNDISRTISCADIENGKSDTFSIEVYVTDEAGNQDLCRTTLIVQDNQNVCPDRNVNSTTVAGLITVINNTKAESVPVKVIQESTGETLEQITNQDGKFSFVDLKMNESYLVSPALDVDPLEGVSTKDIVMIQKHILGIQELSSPYQLIAADVNKSESVTARDLADLRKLILGINDGFPNNSSWNFVDEKFVFDPSNPFKYPSNITLNNVNHEMMENNFVAVKTGDVTGEASTGLNNSATKRNLKISGLEIEMASMQMGQSYSIPVYASNDMSNLEGFQFELKAIEGMMSFDGIESGMIKVDPNHYAIRNQHANQMRISWTSDQVLSVERGQLLFNIKVKAHQNMELNAGALTMNSDGLHAELYTTNNESDLKLLFRSSEQKPLEGSYELYQNIPNPFTGNTTVYFRLPADENVKLSIFDMSGKLIQTYNLTGKKGINTSEINIETEYNGILYYQLDTKNFIATRKMVVIR